MNDLDALEARVCNLEVDIHRVRTDAMIYCNDKTAELVRYTDIHELRAELLELKETISLYEKLIKEWLPYIPEELTLADLV